MHKESSIISQMRDIIAAARPHLEVDPRTPRGKFFLLAIGIDAYKDYTQLRTAVNGARSLAALLVRKFGFEKELVTLLLDDQATRENIIEALRGVVLKMGENDSLVVYFAGHGYLDKEITRRGFWIPVSARQGRAADWIGHTQIIEIMGGAKARHILLISDSCFSGDLKRVADERIEAPHVRRAFAKVSRQVLTSGANEPVADGGIPGHSAYSGTLLRELERTEELCMLTSDLHYRVRAPVAHNTGQVPQFGALQGIGGEPEGEFVFFNHFAAPGEKEDDEAWKCAAKANTVEGWQAYLDLLPSGKHAQEARKRLDSALEVAAQEEASAKAPSSFATSRNRQGFWTPSALTFLGLLGLLGVFLMWHFIFKPWRGEVRQGQVLQRRAAQAAQDLAKDAKSGAEGSQAPAVAPDTWAAAEAERVKGEISWGVGRFADAAIQFNGAAWLYGLCDYSKLSQDTNVVESIRNLDGKAWERVQKWVGSLPAGGAVDGGERDEAEVRGFVSTLQHFHKELERKGSREESAALEARVNSLVLQLNAMERETNHLFVKLQALQGPISETQKKIAAPEGDKAFLEKELKRQLAEKADLERRFSDLEVLRVQVKKFKDELAMARLSEWTNGIYTTNLHRGAERLMQGHSGTNAAPLTNGTAAKDDSKMVSGDSSRNSLSYPPYYSIDPVSSHRSNLRALNLEIDSITNGGKSNPAVAPGTNEQAKPLPGSFLPTNRIRIANPV